MSKTWWPHSNRALPSRAGHPTGAERNSNCEFGANESLLAEGASGRFSISSNSFNVGGFRRRRLEKGFATLRPSWLRLCLNASRILRVCGCSAPFGASCDIGWLTPDCRSLQNAWVARLSSCFCKWDPAKKDFGLSVWFPNTASLKNRRAAQLLHVASQRKTNYSLGGEVGEPGGGGAVRPRCGGEGRGDGVANVDH